MGVGRSAPYWPSRGADLLQASHFELSIFFDYDNGFLAYARGVDIFKDGYKRLSLERPRRMRRVISHMQDSAAPQSTDLSARDLKARPSVTQSGKRLTTESRFSPVDSQ
jgi:hypothetical protein